jgi:anion-transporting  ArsA/GET3 family ATPase
VVTGKGGTGKSTMAAALALVAARQGKRVLCIEIDAKGDVARNLGADPVGFTPKVVQQNISVLALQPEESLQEYLRIYFKVPRFTRLTPLQRVLDFVATGVPGAKDMLIIGKIAYEEKRQAQGAPMWDLIVVDSAATGHVLFQLGAARAMMELTRGGILRSQTEWIDATLSDSRRTLLVICALPEEMPVVEAIELHDLARERSQVNVGICLLNRTFPVPVTARQVDVLARAASAKHLEATTTRLDGDPVPVLEGARLAQRLHEASQQHLRRLRRRLSVPVIEVPLQVAARPGLSMTRAVAAELLDATP